MSDNEIGYEECKWTQTSAAAYGHPSPTAEKIESDDETLAWFPCDGPGTGEKCDALLNNETAQVWDFNGYQSPMCGKCFPVSVAMWKEVMECDSESDKGAFFVLHKQLGGKNV